MTRILLGNPFEVLFRDFFDTDSFFNEVSNCKVSYPVDIYENDKGLNVEVAVIGLDKEDVNISVESDILRVSYKKDNSNDDSITYIRHGIARRSFDLGWKIGSQFDLTKLEAVMNKGLLKIQIPLSDKAAPVKVDIKSE